MITEQQYRDIKEEAKELKEQIKHNRVLVSIAETTMKGYRESKRLMEIK